MDDKRGRVWVTRRADEEYLQECLVPTFKKSSLRVMVWGCIADGRKGPLIVVEYPGGKGGGMTAELYQRQVLEGVFLGFFRQLKRERHYVYFQQDSAPAHSSRSTKKWFKNHRIKLLYHPPNSPDLSPIEPVWQDLKRIVRRNARNISTIEGLRTAVREAWKEIPIERINKHVSSMPDRVRAVLAVKGGHTWF